MTAADRAEEGHGDARAPPPPQLSPQERVLPFHFLILRKEFHFLAT